MPTKIKLQTNQHTHNQTDDPARQAAVATIFRFLVVVLYVFLFCRLHGHQSQETKKEENNRCVF
jgi:hypothetical protein